MDISTLESFQYDFSIVKAATNDFSEENKLGWGEFGAVYKVYIPIPDKEQNWLLFIINLKSLELKNFFANIYDTINCGDSFCVHRRVHQIVLEFESLFLWFLGRISYWKHSEIYETGAMQIVGDVVWPDHTDRVGRNSGVIICMLMEKLVRDRSLTWNEGQDACFRYRRYMADELYAVRFTPVNV
ncbi:uncharacterized protein LOC110934743 isoform X4 [Helianthus annuus]|nr:uncharacterized protein LOC110934743 isoform X4 [Helianthus annuus]